ncbi:MAG: diguanylate cyclase [Sulfuricellaceae bacterium]|jgi:diguanylate cyclase (GGDEF)-like protein
MSEAEFHQKMASLKELYRSQLPGKLDELEALWRKLRDAGGQAGEWAEFVRGIHSLGGSGAVFGFTALSTSCRALEIFLQPIADHPASLTDALRYEIDDRLAMVRRFADGQEPEQPPPAVPSAPSTAATVERRIFVVESDEALMADLVQQLGYYGYQVERFGVVASMMGALRSQSPMAVLLDMDCVGADGALEAWRQMENPPPLLPFSYRSDLDARLAAARGGARAYFTKPVEFNALIDALDNLAADLSAEPYNVLIVEDTASLGEYYASVLQNAGMTTRLVTDPLRIMEGLADFNPELILMDMYMPGCSGTELAAVIRQLESYVSVPIVFLSSETDVNRQLEAMGQGGDDFLTKPIRPEHLVSSVRIRADRYRILRHFMVRDSLTGLLNHTRTKERLDVELARAERLKSPLSFAMIDIDHFKQVNDVHGHPTGDRVIRSLSRLLVQRLRKTDIVGRYGGEEFAVVLPDTPIHQAERVLNEVRESFSRILQPAEGKGFRCTFSCGIAAYPAHATAAELNNAADEALYAAKGAGRNRVTRSGEA